MQARTPFLFKMGVHSYYNCGIRSEDHFCSLNELKETASLTKAEFQEKELLNTRPYSRSPRSKITKNTTADYKIKCKTYSNIPKQHVVWLVLLKKIQHIFSDTETVFLIQKQFF